MEIGVIGINDLAITFYRHWINRGHKILFADLHPYAESYSQVEAMGANISLVLPSKAVRVAEVIVLAVAQKQLETAAEMIGDVHQKILIDLTIDEDSLAPGSTQKSSFEEIQSLFPNAKVVKITTRSMALPDPIASNTLYSYSNDNLAQRLVHWLTEGAGYRLINVSNNKTNLKII